MHLNVRQVAVALTLSLTPAIALAQGAWRLMAGAPNLRGLMEVSVGVSLPGGQWESLRPHMIQALEDAAQEAGLRVVADTARVPGDRKALLIFDVQLGEEQDGRIPYSVELSMLQPMLLAREVDIRTLIASWRIPGLPRLARRKELNQKVGKTADELSEAFVEFFRSANSPP